MLISKKWLNQYLDVSEYTIMQLADKITNAGLEVEGIIKMSTATNLVIGQIKECKPHPTADKLQVCLVDIKDDVIQIVCGAKNARENLKVIVALPGAVLANTTISKGMIRDIESNGMMCSLVELGVDPKNLSEEQQNGIEELDDNAPVGEKNPLKYLGLDDEILDIGLTPNRNDCLASWSMAKEVAAILNKKANIPYAKNYDNEGSDTKLLINSTTDKCPLFLGKVINKVCVKESPKWMKELLASSGIKSINNVVDISNIVMLETGQPLHFYDLNKLEKLEITVKDGIDTTYTALDGIDYKIDNNDLMITCNDKPIGIAGIMGGDDSKIEPSTTGIIIESALFNNVSIRNSARKFGLCTDASIRFQKGLEPLSSKKAMDRAIDLLIEYADADELEKTVYYGSLNTDVKVIEISYENINKLLGTSFTLEEVIDVLSRLDFNPVVNDKITVTIPTYRTDLVIEEDIIEEVIRIIGYDRLPSTLPLMKATVGTLNNRQKMRRAIRTMLVNNGFNEAITYTLVSQDELDSAIMPLDKPYELASPMSEERRYIRTSILPSLLESVSFNQNRSIKNIALFEISNVYEENKYEERLAIAIANNLHQSKWQKINIPADFYTLKGLVLNLLNSLGFTSNRIYFKENKTDVTRFNPYRSAEVYLGKELIGIMGDVHPKCAKQYDVNDVVMLELRLEALLNNKASKVKYVAVNKYPSVTRDLALVVKKDVKASDIIDTINKANKLISNVEIFDIYTGEHVDEGYKSIALTITLTDVTATLKDDVINDTINNVITNLEKSVNAQLRK